MKRRAAKLGLLLGLATCSAQAVEDAEWVGALRAEIEKIDLATPGTVGVHVRDLASGSTVDRHGDRMWYLSSTIKVPLAIAVLQLVEEGKLALEQELVLQQSDFVDGAGDLIWQEPGARYSLRTLIGKSLVDSDSTATDMLVRLIGEDELNRRIRGWVPEGFGPITSIVQVRYDAYGLLHPGVARLSNMDLVRLRNADAGEPRLQALLRALDAERDSLALGSIDEAFERYYETHRNSSTLEAFATLLELLVTGSLLSPEHTEMVLGDMRRITTGERRIKAGLPRSAVFAQKTGTQLARACNMGVLLTEEGRQQAVVVAACVEKYAQIADAERALQQLGRALADAGLVQH
jgi:beta-lactamase class A